MDRGVSMFRELNQSTNHASIPSVGIRVMIWKILQNQNDIPEMDMLAVACFLQKIDEKKVRRIEVWQSFSIDPGMWM